MTFCDRVESKLRRVMMACPPLLSKLDDSQVRLLERMKSDNNKSSPPFTPSSIVWEKLSRTMERALHLDGTQDIENSVVNHWFSAQRPGHRKYYEYACWMLYGHLKARDRLGIVDRVVPSAPPGVTVELAGHKLSWDALISLYSVLGLVEINPAILTAPLTVLEVGGGWGRMGYTLKKLNPSLVYIACDIPVSLLVAQSYLPTVLPDEVVHDYLMSRSVENFTKDQLVAGGGIWFCGTHDLPRFESRSIDVFLNIASFQEMSVEQVRLYMEEVSRITNGTFYHLQRFQGDQVGRGTYPYPNAWRNIFDRPVVHMPNYFEAGYLIE